MRSLSLSLSRSCNLLHTICCYCFYYYCCFSCCYCLLLVFVAARHERPLRSSYVPRLNGCLASWPRLQPRPRLIASTCECECEFEICDDLCVGIGMCCPYGPYSFFWHSRACRQRRNACMCASVSVCVWMGGCVCVRACVLKGGISSNYCCCCCCSCYRFEICQHRVLDPCPKVAQLLSLES